MKLYENTAASFPLDARDIFGQKIDATIIEGATYTLRAAEKIVVKTLGSGLRIEYSDNSETTNIFVDLTADDLNFYGRARQELIYSNDGIDYQGSTLRPTFIDVISRN